MNKLKKADLERYLEDFVLNGYNIDSDIDLVWSKHVSIGPDSFAHYFRQEHDNYVLVFEKKLGSKNLLPNTSDVNLATDDHKTKFIHIETTPETGYIENVTGYFTLYYDHAI